MDLSDESLQQIAKTIAAAVLDIRAGRPIAPGSLSPEGLEFAQCIARTLEGAQRREFAAMARRSEFRVIRGGP